MGLNRIGTVLLAAAIFLAVSLPIKGDSCSDESVVACYYASWGTYRADDGNFKINFINPNLCTHLIYTFAGINLNGVIDSLDYSNDITYAGYKSFNELKEKNPCLKTLLAIGGWNEGSEKYSLMVESEESRKTFIDSVLRYITYFGFDGLDIDWEYPNQRGGITEDKENFVLLLQSMKEAFAKRNKILTVAIGVSRDLVNAAYNVQEMCEAVDLVFTMAYDLQMTNTITSHAPLKRESKEPVSRPVIEEGIHNLIQKGCPSDKIVLGIGAFGRTYTMKTTSAYNIYDAASGKGNPGPYTQEEGHLGYNEICNFINKDKWTQKYLSNNVMSYAYKNDQWVSFDDPQKSIPNKATYAKQNKLKGLMLYSIDTDDFHGECFNQTFPLLRAINTGLNRKINK